MDTTSNTTATSQREAEHYNYEHFKPGVLMKDAQLIQHPENPRPGELAPEFSLEDTNGQTWSLRELRGRPAVFLIGSGTCPVTQGNLPGLQELYSEYSDRCQWLMLYVREAHPGEKMSAHKSHEQKRSQADYFREVTNTPWPVLVDEVNGEVHKQYGLLPNSVFLIDADGRVSFVGEISHAPTLRKALEHLFEQNMRGVVPEGEDKTPHMLGPTAYGWEAIERGGEVSMRDVAKHMPPLAMNLWGGEKVQSLLDPLASRSQPLPPKAKAGLAIGAAALAGFLVWSLTHARD
jgi:cytochrome oxidase Cu insertion factor (SCO1/SenC/PrrC family)